jgi:hypothetical protein
MLALSELIRALSVPEEDVAFSEVMKDIRALINDIRRPSDSGIKNFILDQLEKKIFQYDALASTNMEGEKDDSSEDGGYQFFSERGDDQDDNASEDSGYQAFSTNGDDKDDDPEDRDFSQWGDEERPLTQKNVAFSSLSQNHLIIGAIITSLEQLQLMGLDTPAMYNQTWFIDRMKACGYDLDEGGHCFGLTHMALTAFLADDLESFNTRLVAIAHTLLSDCQCDEDKTPFFNLRRKAEQLTREGNVGEANQLTDAIVNMTAFFDGIALHHSPGKYVHLISENETKPILQTQNAQRTMPIVLPVALDTEEKRPVLVKSVYQTYSKAMFIGYLTTLKESLGEHNSFAVELNTGAGGHSINLNYNHKTQRWICIDPNFLPGYEFIHADLLANELFKGFQKKESLTIDTKFYVCMAQKNQIEASFFEMEQTEAWIELHALSNEAILSSDGLLSRHIKNNQLEWLEASAPHLTEEVLNKVLSLSTIHKNADVIHILLNYTNIKPEKFMYDIAYSKDRIDVIGELLERGLEPTDIMFKMACLEGKDDVINALMQHGLEPTKNMFDFACKRGRMDVIKVLTEHGYKANTTQRFKMSFSAMTEMVKHGFEKKGNEVDLPNKMGHDFKK